MEVVEGGGKGGREIGKRGGEGEREREGGLGDATRERGNEAATSPIEYHSQSYLALPLIELCRVASSRLAA